jgi:hypothetical protein
MPILAAVLEVMDKEWSLLTVWLIFLSLGVVGLFLTRLRRWLIVPALLVIAVAAYALVVEITDPQVGPAIVQEAGRGYVIQSYIAIGVATVLTLVGLRSRPRAV